jgi:hypothetical protein
MCAAGGWRPEEGTLPTDEKADARIRVRAGLQLEGSSSSASDTHKERIAHAAKRTRVKGIELLDGDILNHDHLFCACVSALRVHKGASSAVEAVTRPKEGTPEAVYYQLPVGFLLLLQPCSAAECLFFRVYHGESERAGVGGTLLRRSTAAFT